MEMEAVFMDRQTPWIRSRERDFESVAGGNQKSRITGEELYAYNASFIIEPLNDYGHDRL